jgi:hypothetical protein
MDRVEGKNKGSDTPNSAIDFLCLASELSIRSAAWVIWPVTPNTSPSTSTIPDLTESDMETLNANYPFYPDYLQKYSNAFDETHAYILDQTFFSSDDLNKLKKDYLTFITHQLNKTPGVKHNNPDYYAEILEKLLTKSPVEPIKTKITIEQTSQTTEIDSSLAYLWKTCDKKKSSPGINIFLDEMADAHGLIQATGWSTQNENSLLAVLDAHNYVRYRSNIAEGRFILRSLADPFYPLFTEYQDIAHREKNTLLKILRTAVPMLITAGFMLSMMALIPVALPELAFIIAAIPLLYLGLIAAALYVKTKELFYQSYRHLRYHGDLEQFPEFRLNSNLVDAFGEEKALDVRTYYIQAIKACNAIENTYKGINRLSTEETAAREANVEKSHALLLEWFDLHDNNKFCRDKAPLIALRRINTDKNILNKKLNTALEQQDRFEIKEFVSTMAKHLHKTLADPEFHDAEETASEEFTFYDAEEAPSKPISSLRFFPSYVEQRSEIIQLQTLEEQISANLQI